MNTNNKYIKIINYQDFNKWYVSYYINPFSISSDYKLVSLAEILYPVKNRIKKDDYDGSIPIVKKISFDDGKIHLRENRKTGMDLYKVENGQLLVSKINFHQGAVALNDNSHLACSTHYQPYLINTDEISKEYLVRILRSNRFNNFVKQTRADGIKNEATYEFIKTLQIPLPSLEAQLKLLQGYNQKLKKAGDNLTRAIQLESKIDDYLLESLKVKFQKPRLKKRFYSINYSEVDRWAVDYLRKQHQISDIKKSKYPIHKLESLIKYLQYGISEKANTLGKGIPMLRMNNIKNGHLDISKLKFFELPNGKKDTLSLKKGDLLFNRTNSKELVGKTAVFNLDEEFTFASYLIRVQLNEQKVNVKFINYLFNSSIGRKQIDITSRQVLGQANINSQELKEFIFPIPPLDTQNKIVLWIEEKENEIEDLRSDADKNRIGAIKEFEKAIYKG